MEAFVEDLTGQRDVFDAPREYELVPPSINTDGVRRIMRHFCVDARLKFNDRHGYFAPHGGRRGAGEVMVRQCRFTAVARLLDNSKGVVRQSYSHIEARVMAEDVGDVFAEHDA